MVRAAENYIGSPNRFWPLDLLQALPTCTIAGFTHCCCQAGTLIFFPFLPEVFFFSKARSSSMEKSLSTFM